MKGGEKADVRLNVGTAASAAYAGALGGWGWGQLGEQLLKTPQPRLPAPRTTDGRAFPCGHPERREVLHLRKIRGFRSRDGVRPLDVHLGRPCSLTGCLSGLSTPLLQSRLQRGLSCWTCGSQRMPAHTFHGSPIFSQRGPLVMRISYPHSCQKQPYLRRGPHVLTEHGDRKYSFL